MHMYRPTGRPHELLEKPQDIKINQARQQVILHALDGPHLLLCLRNLFTDARSTSVLQVSDVARHREALLLQLHNLVR